MLNLLGEKLLVATKSPHPPSGPSPIRLREEATADRRRRLLHALCFVTIAFSRLRLRKWEKVPDRVDEGSLLRVMALKS
jgi:hypothetical protein